ncbi:uncharacterized protein LOC139932085 isoform X2 [Centroberyx gerrardi]
MASPTGRGESGNGKDQTLEVGTALLKDFIHERVQRHGDSNTEVTRAQLGERELSESERKIVQQLDCSGSKLPGTEFFLPLILLLARRWQFS